MNNSQNNVTAGLRARLDGSISTVVTDATVLVVGLGSGGSQTVEALVRSSVKNLIVIDMDEVDLVNLSRSVYDAADVGVPKTEAITRRMQAINPDVTIEGKRCALDDIDPAELAQMVSRADLVVAATDDPSAQARLNRVAWHSGVPAVFAGVYEKGAAGEVIFTIPGVTTCFRCATGGVRGDRRGTAQINYGTGQLVAEPALGADITHVVSASVKVALGLIELGDKQAWGNSSAALVLSAAASSRNFLQMSTVPNWDYFPQVFTNTPGQHGYQSVWLGTNRNPECPVCGDNPVLDGTDAAPDLTALRLMDG
jgi:hypothetical protein